MVPTPDVEYTSMEAHMTFYDRNNTSTLTDPDMVPTWSWTTMGDPGHRISALLISTKMVQNDASDAILHNHGPDPGCQIHFNEGPYDVL